MATLKVRITISSSSSNTPHPFLQHAQTTLVTLYLHFLYSLSPTRFSSPQLTSYISATHHKSSASIYINQYIILHTVYYQQILILSKCSVTLIMTACAGRFTPQARVAVHTSTLINPLLNRFSTKFLKRNTINGFQNRRKMTRIEA